jgi:hypothetical protein
VRSRPSSASGAGRPTSNEAGAVVELGRLPTDKDLAETEQEIYEMLVAEHPKMADAERKRLAAEGARECAKLLLEEKLGKAGSACACGDPKSRHVAGVGKCKEPTCDCTEFTSVQ